jgi:cell division protein FtsB
MMADPEIKPLLIQIVKLVEGLHVRMDAMQSDMTGMKTDIGELKSNVASLQTNVASLQTGQAVIAARLDEQRATVNALIPTRLAAIPAAE